MTFRGEFDEDDDEVRGLDAELSEDVGSLGPANLQHLAADVDALRRRADKVEAQLANTVAAVSRLDNETTVMDRQLGENFSQVPRKEVWYVAWLALLLGIVNCWRIN